MKLTDATVELIKTFEGFKTRVYRDAVGRLTVGYGHLIFQSEHLKLGDSVSPEFADTLLRSDLGIAIAAVKNLVTIDLADNQFGALVSFTYNVGAKNLMRSTLLKKVNSKQFAGAAEEFKRWDKARKPNGAIVQLAGLTRRREAEAKLFQSKES